jgi:hypothetical protein
MGDNFGLNDNYEYFEFCLDSLDADCSFNGASAATDWPSFTVAAKGPLQDVVAVKILEAQIPVSWYVFNSVNNTFVITETTGGAKTITIPVGNYTASQLATSLSTIMTPGSAGTNATYTVTYDANLTHKFTFASNSTTNVFTFTFGAGYNVPGVQPNSGNKNPRLWIGFPPGDTVSSVQPTNQTIVSPNVALVSGANYIYVNSQRLGSDVDVFLPAGAFNLSGGRAGPQMAKIPVNANTNGVIIWQDPDPQKWFKYDQLQSMNGFDFYLSLGNTTSQLPLQLNGLSFSLKLGVLKQLKTGIDRVIPTAQNGRVSRREGPKRPRPVL